MRYLTSQVPINGFSSTSAWSYFRTDIPKQGYTMIIEVDQMPSDNYADCDVYVNLGSYPTHRRYVYRDITLDDHVRIVAPNSSPGSWFIGVFGFQECRFSIKATITKNSCPDGCNGRGTCVNGVCDCDDGWAGASCNQRVTVLQLGSNITDDVMNREFRYFRVPLANNIPTLKLTLQELVLDDENDLDIYAKHGSLPTTSDWDYANSSLSKTTELRIPNAVSGDYYIGIYAYRCAGISCRFRLSAEVSGTCPNECSRRGSCVSNRCNCGNDYSGDYCETKNSVINYGAKYEGYVDDNTWNYFPFTTNSMNTVAVYLYEKSIRNGDCDIYVKRGYTKPTLSSYDYFEISANTTATLPIPQPGSSHWWIGIYGYRRCDFYLTVRYQTSNSDCKNGGTRPNPTEPCRCPTGYTGTLCEYTIERIRNGEVKSGTIERGGWDYYRLDLTSFPSDVVIYVKEEDTSTVGNIWLFASIEATPTVGEHDYEDIDADTNYHMIRITNSQITHPNRPTFIVIGVHASSNTLRPSNDYKLTVWTTPFSK